MSARLPDAPSTTVDIAPKRRVGQHIDADTSYDCALHAEPRAPPQEDPSTSSSRLLSRLLGRRRPRTTGVRHPVELRGRTRICAQPGSPRWARLAADGTATTGHTAAKVVVADRAIQNATPLDVLTVPITNSTTCADPATWSLPGSAL